MCPLTSVRCGDNSNVTPLRWHGEGHGFDSCGPTLNRQPPRGSFASWVMVDWWRCGRRRRGEQRMSTSVTITGTGCPIPDANRAGPGVLVRTDDLTLQFDVGRSTVQRLAGAHVWVPDLSAVFLTHYHSDHVTGLHDLVLTYWTMDRTDRGRPLPIIAPEGATARFVSTLLDGWVDDIEVRAAHSGRDHRPVDRSRRLPRPRAADGGLAAR